MTENDNRATVTIEQIEEEAEQGIAEYLRQAGRSEGMTEPDVSADFHNGFIAGARFMIARSSGGVA